MGKAAIWYAKHGWFVVPLHMPLFDENGKCIGCSCEAWRRENYDRDYVCPAPGKHPPHNEWERISSNDPEQVGRWWWAWPGTNIGIAAGKSGLVVLDADLYKEGGETINYETITSLTGGGGEHLIFKHPHIDTKIGNSKRGLPSYIDVRAWGGQFVVPPSIHPSGNVYEWEVGYGPHAIEPLILPDNIAEPLGLAAQELSESVDLAYWDFVGLYPNAPKMFWLFLALFSNCRSRLDFLIFWGLMKAGVTNEEIYAIYRAHDPTGKFSGKNGSGKKYLAHTIAKAASHLKKRKEYQPTIDPL